MLRAIMNGQSAMKQELLAKIDSVNKKLGNRIGSLEEKVDAGFKGVNQRIDKLGESLAFLEDDAPTREEHENLEKRVSRVENKVASLQT